jgi:hypothetical protein
MNIVEATHRYEAWLARQLALEDLSLDRQMLRVKHDEMSGTPFAFLRATFYRWAQHWLKGQRAWHEAPELLAVGDLHVENFGTWRDSEGRLVWGVNDFDEACRLPYTNDLVRLAVSAQLAIADNHILALGFQTACRHILTGYEATLRTGKVAAAPLVLSEENKWLREIAAVQLRHPDKFWNKLDCAPPTRLEDTKAATRALKKVTAHRGGKSIAQRGAVPPPAMGASTPDGATGLNIGDVPPGARAAIEAQFPPEFHAIQWKRRQAGLGSLGRPRFVALGTWQGGRLAREGKALVASAAVWAQGRPARESFVAEIVAHAVRCRDPQFTVQGCWLVRRLAPDCTKLELFDVPKRREEQFLFAMGREIANIHLGTCEAVPSVLKHLKKLPGDWLEEAAHEGAKKVMKDWTVWREHHWSARDAQ